MLSTTPGTVAAAIWQDREVPTGAQCPQQSAHSMLAGVANNERLVPRDQQDMRGAKHCFDPDTAAAMDEYLLNVARKRRRGKWVV